jgi:formylglycine-generating enzyme required for sulfatase activity
MVPEGTYSLGQGDGLPPGDLAHRIPPRAASSVTLAPFCMDVFEFPGGVGDRPKVSVSWREARDLCASKGKRLCTEDEWEAACRGPESHPYSYGPQRKPGICNTDVGEFEDSSSAQLWPNDPGRSCINWVGVHNLNGNVSEWVAGNYEGPSYPQLSGAPEPKGVARHILRGGAPWPAFYGQDCLSRHWHSEGYDRGDDDGFRCCADSG